MDLETRELRYFVALAEELHFGRAAERLGVSQPPLSRAIRLLESRLGVPLFVRTSRSVRLTDAGETLLVEGRRALGAVSSAARKTQRVGRGMRRLVLAIKPGGDAALLKPILDHYAETPDALPIELVFNSAERGEMVRDGRADLALLHRPQNDMAGLDWTDLRTERQVVLLPEGHRLAGLAAVSMVELEAEPHPLWPESLARSTGRPVSDLEEVLQLVQLGRMVVLLPESVRERLPVSVVWRPVTDAVPATLVLAWQESSTSPDVATFVRAATEAAARGCDGIRVNVQRTDR
ncbi:LysR family transcriptional regulator [Brachybacterium endophyticum]|uniref:LysR family transcriptional regulator n=1 Tax=Brachybacterium endophyticum TaxID=2182385 RepID=A0A2U2RGS0_9MICO|nr:LysR family transcriptional regulator [Brachybacterium endophyticum]PWH05050.1 LysR family transcriptional regulator [Brachybacterium endophyticum]